MVRHCVNLVKGVNAVFPAPISRDYRRGDIEGHMAEFILCWCNNSPPLKGRPANDFSTVHVRQGDNAFFHTDPKLRRQRCSRVCLIFRCGKSLLFCIQALGKRHRRYCRQYENYRLHIYRRKNYGRAPSDSGDRAKRCLSEVKPPTGFFGPGRKCVETSDDVIENDFTGTLDSRILDLSPMRLGAAMTARAPTNSEYLAKNLAD